jgi:hypothetical protein
MQNIDGESLPKAISSESESIPKIISNISIHYFSKSVPFKLLKNALFIFF